MSHMQFFSRYCGFCHFVPRKHLLGFGGKSNFAPLFVLKNGFFWFHSHNIQHLVHSMWAKYHFFQHKAIFGILSPGNIFKGFEKKCLIIAILYLKFILVDFLDITFNTGPLKCYPKFIFLKKQSILAFCPQETFFGFLRKMAISTILSTQKWYQLIS